ncbi:MAG: transposase, partial [Rhodoblastus sp.]
MLSAIVLAPNGADPLSARANEAVARSLGALVGAAVANVVRDACIVGAPQAGLAALADHAGCALIEDAHMGAGLERSVRAA